MVDKNTPIIGPIIGWFTGDDDVKPNPPQGSQGGIEFRPVPPEIPGQPLTPAVPTIPTPPPPPVFRPSPGEGGIINRDDIAALKKIINNSDIINRDDLAKISKILGSDKIINRDDLTKILDIIGEDGIINRDDLVKISQIIGSENIINRDDLRNFFDTLWQDENIINRDDLAKLNSILDRTDIINRDDLRSIINGAMEQTNLFDANEIIGQGDPTDTWKAQRRAVSTDQPLEIKDTGGDPRIGAIPEEPTLSPDDIRIVTTEEQKIIHARIAAEEEARKSGQIPRMDGPGYDPNFKLCPFCTEWNWAENKYCQFCGMKMEYEELEVKYCQKCGARNPIGNVFCAQCQTPFPSSTDQEVSSGGHEDRGVPWGTFVPTESADQNVVNVKYQRKTKSKENQWQTVVVIVIGVIIGFGAAVVTPAFDITLPVEINNLDNNPGFGSVPEVSPPESKPPDPVSPPGSSGNSSSNEQPVYVPPSQPDTVDECQVFDNISIATPVIFGMQSCNPTLKFNFEMSEPIPGKVPPSPNDWSYWATVGDVGGDCFLGEYDERLFCEVVIPPKYSFTMQRFELFVDRCDDTIYSQRLTVPEIQGCGELPPSQSGCTSGEILGGGSSGDGINTQSSCESQGYSWQWIDAYYYCVCP